MIEMLCNTLGIEKPFLSAPLGGAAGPELVAAVSNAGGFGVIPLWGDPSEEVREGIRLTRAMTDNHFAVNLNVSVDYRDALQVCIDEGVHAVSLFWGHDPYAIEMAKAGGLVVMASVGSAQEAKIAQEAGADIIIAQGWEAGGHVWGKVATIALVPAVVDAVNVPVVAAGGISDGRGMAAALMLGAAGVWIGTRFLASPEAKIHATYRDAILNASEEQAEWYANLYDGHWQDAPHRALRNATSETWLRAGRPPSGSRPNEKEVIGTRPDGGAVARYESYTPGPNTTGDVAAMSLWSGQGAGLVHAVKPAADIVDEICRDAKRIISAVQVSARVVPD